MGCRFLIGYFLRMYGVASGNIVNAATECHGVRNATKSISVTTITSAHFNLYEGIFFNQGIDSTRTISRPHSGIMRYHILSVNEDVESLPCILWNVNKTLKCYICQISSASARDILLDDEIPGARIGPNIA